MASGGGGGGIGIGGWRRPFVGIAWTRGREREGIAGKSSVKLDEELAAGGEGDAGDGSEEVEEGEE